MLAPMSTRPFFPSKEPGKFSSHTCSVGKRTAVTRTGVVARGEMGGGAEFSECEDGLMNRRQRHFIVLDYPMRERLPSK